jgi:hypothetical protein
MITAYLRQKAYHLPRPFRVEPIERSADSTYENPEREQKGKCELPEKPKKAEKFPGKFLTIKRHTLSIWV